MNNSGSCCNDASTLIETGLILGRVSTLGFVSNNVLCNTINNLPPALARRRLQQVHPAPQSVHSAQEVAAPRTAGQSLVALSAELQLLVLAAWAIKRRQYQEQPQQAMIRVDNSPQRNSDTHEMNGNDPQRNLGVWHEVAGSG